MASKYIGRKVKLFPSDTITKYATIIDVDDLGWTFKITEVSSSHCSYSVGQIVFFNHSHNITFIFEN